MADVQERNQTTQIEIDQEKHIDSQHKEVATSGSEVDNDHVDTSEEDFKNTPWTLKDRLAAISLSGLYVGSQIPLYFTGASLSFIAADIGGAKASAWLPVSYALALAAVAPFSGYLQDLIGRRNITLVGGTVLMVGIVVLATAKQFSHGVVAMTLAGAGAAIGELTALAGTAELVPVKSRGYYLSLVTGFVLPFTPYILYAQLLSTYHTWRWGIWICLIYNGIWMVGIATMYFPQSQTRLTGEDRKAVLGKIDYVGGLTSIGGLTLFLVAMQAGGYSHPWTSPYVLATMIIGFFLIAAFVVWEWKYAKLPMVPHEMFAGQRIVALAYGIAFVAGMNFYAVLNFFPTLFHDVFPPDPVQVGLKGFAPGLSTTVGAVFVNACLTWFKGWNRELLLVSCIIMTAFSGALAVITPDDGKLVVFISTMTGFGVGGVLVPAATVAVMVCPDVAIATCVALSLAIRTVGGSIGYAIYFNIFINKINAKIGPKIAEYAIQAGLPAENAEAFVGALLLAPETLSQVPGVTPEVMAGAAMGSRWAYAESLRWVWISSIPFGVLACVACCFLPPTTKYMTGRVAAKLRH